MQLQVQKFGAEHASEKPDVILIHGTGGNANLWQEQVKPLVKLGFRCYLPELRGHGSTSEPGEETDLSVHVSDVIETLQNEDIRFPAIFIGHSLGAIISIQIAGKFPEMLRQCLAVSLPVKVPKLTAGAFKLFLNGAYHKMQKSKLKGRLPVREQALLETDWHSLSQILKHFGPLDLTNEVANVPVPVHFAYGRLDIVAPCVYGEKVHKAIPNSTLQIFEWAGHNVMDDRPHEFRDWMLDKVTRHR
ncbi:MAG: alpha/beta hydrolase [Candidatus Obscuribacterales bacterium]|nr:alpha/beta hydrolase [Candidatus Obscuribacterales bacterium]